MSGAESDKPVAQRGTGGQVRNVGCNSDLEDGNGVSAECGKLLKKLNCCWEPCFEPRSVTWGQAQQAAGEGGGENGEGCGYAIMLHLCLLCVGSM